MCKRKGYLGTPVLLTINLHKTSEQKSSILVLSQIRHLKIDLKMSGLGV